MNIGQIVEHGEDDYVHVSVNLERYIYVLLVC